MTTSFFSKRISLRVKLTIPFVTIAVLPLFLVMFITIQNLQALQREQTANTSRLVAQEATAEIQSFIELQFEVLKNIGSIHPEFARDPVIRDILLERFLHRSDAFLSIALLDRTGQEIAKKDLVQVIGQADLRNRAESAEFRAILEHGSYVGPFVVSKGKPFFFLGREIRGADGAFQGAVVAQVDARTLQDVVTAIPLQEEHIRTYIVNEKGRVIAHPDISEVLAERNLSFLAPVQKFVRELRGSATTQTYHNEQGEEVLGTSILFNAEGNLAMVERWLIIVEQPTSIALAPVREVRQLILLVVAGILLLAFVGAIVITNSLARPISALQKGAREIGLGNLDYKFHVKTNDELQDLATELDKMRLHLKEIRAREENLSRLKSEFVSIVAHQLRTPLSALKWAIALFQEAQPKMSAGQKDLVEKMSKSNERMIHLVNDLLDAARIEEGRFVYNRTHVALEEVIGRVLDAVRQKSKQKKVPVKFQKPKEPLPLVFVDRDAMELVLQNLVENALHYTPPGGKVSIQAQRSDSNSILVTVQDTGIGITKEEKDRIFSKFFRGANAVKLETEGSGLGLFIVKNIMEAHGGKTWFESKEGKGTSFHFTIPLK